MVVARLHRAEFQLMRPIGSPLVGVVVELTLKILPGEVLPECHTRERADQDQYRGGHARER
jgi:hypothetical protein